MVFNSYDKNIEKRLTNKERKIINKIHEKASKRSKKREYTPKWVIGYLLECYKDYSYDEKQDAIDMLDTIFEIAKKCNVMTDKQIEKERKYMMKEYVKGMFEDD